ncbi:subtilisin-like protease 4 [Dioscorea cayenensis subsp. rotundata]|uniref:Subtilisin-like protease 4 n=1 Tax=Dioscorea cayennensis subsp. rotundata TaxID=55577 RepID=A0AB40B6L8_DIOCR|nr:subtilisin-like protease 4 [Dioscorea cayenensis subsp. rotundata]
MEKMDGFLRANLRRTLHLQMTYTHDFLNLSILFGVWSTSNSFYGEGIIIGVLDIGIHMPYPSFDNTGMPPRPAGWNASCYLRTPCNGKVITVQSFDIANSTTPPSDIDQGYGTHVADIAVGNFVDNAEVLNQALGRAAGMAPKAFISVYKDDVAVGTFSAMQKGIFPYTAACNNGLDPETLGHAAPWDMVIGATTTDRRIRATAILGNGTQLHGESAYQPNMVTNQFCPLVYQENIEKGKVVRNARGAGVILMNFDKYGNTTFSDAHHLRGAYVSYKDAIQLKD